MTPAPRWRSLTTEVEVRDGLPRGQLNRLMHAARSVQRDYSDAVGPLLVAPRGANPGTLGTAFDLWLQMQAAPRPPLKAAASGARRAGPPLQEAFQELLGLLAKEPHPQPRHGAWQGPAQTVSDSDLFRVCWAAALFVEVYQLGVVMPGSALAEPTHPSAESLLQLAPDAAVAELGDLADVARERLLPELRDWAGRGPTWLGPIFSGSRVMAADADTITGQTLLEVKTGLGNKSGSTRRASLDGPTMRQLLAYVLHDYDDRYALDRVALYQARYGHLALWPLEELLPALVGGPVDLAAERERWRGMLLAP